MNKSIAVGQKTEDTAKGPSSLSAAIHYPPVPPVLADGLFPHTAKFDEELETDVDIPNINAVRARFRLSSSWQRTAC